MTLVSDTKDGGNCCDGELVEVSGDQLMFICGKGDEHHYTVAADATITCDGEEVELADLQEGSAIRMTMCKDDRNKILAIDCGEHVPE